MHWPNERKPAELIDFYGDPVLHSSIHPGWERDNIVDLIPPYEMRYSWGPPVTKLRFHRKCRDAFGEALLAIKVLYGAQKDIEAHRLHLTGGSLMVRLKRGSSKAWSTHSFGAALDIDPQHNPFRSKWRRLHPARSRQVFPGRGPDLARRRRRHRSDAFPGGRAVSAAAAMAAPIISRPSTRRAPPLGRDRADRGQIRAHRRAA